MKKTTEQSANKKGIFSHRNKVKYSVEDTYLKDYTPEDDVEMWLHRAIKAMIVAGRMRPWKSKRSFFHNFSDTEVYVMKRAEFMKMLVDNGVPVRDAWKMSFFVIM